ncbi:MAG: LLM class flavin-dependent oxidoreductase, partial [Candidatus Dormibacteria bacterium]
MVAATATGHPPLRLGLGLGYWGAEPPADAAGLVAEAERLGFDSVFTSEAYGSDALTPLAWLGSSTSRLRLGTAVAQIHA